MKRIFSALLAALLLFSPCVRVSAEEPSTSARAAFLMESGGTVLYEKNADEKLPMASTTKIMTALVALETLDSDAVVTVRPEACGIEGSGIRLTAGNRVDIRSARNRIFSALPFRPPERMGDLSIGPPTPRHFCGIRTAKAGPRQTWL